MSKSFLGQLLSTGTEYNQVPKKTIDKEIMTELSYNESTSQLKFVIKHYHREPKITRYVTNNYVRKPIYGDYWERTKLLKKFDKTINPVRFVNEDILHLGLKKPFIIAIIKKINLIPEWYKKELKLQTIEQAITNNKNNLRDFNKEKNNYHFKTTNLQENSGNFWLRFLFGFVTLFLSFYGYISKATAQLNREINDQNKTFNEKHKIDIDEKNAQLLKEISNYNKKINDKITSLEKEYEKVEAIKISYENPDQDGWIDLKKASNFNYASLQNQKGIYIIWNKTKNKYYVGQSKNIGKRLAQQFKDGEVKNIIFAKDWFENDQFAYKCYLCKTKDELDDTQRKFIGIYNSNEWGYNSTSGKI